MDDNTIDEFLIQKDGAQGYGSTPGITNLDPKEELKKGDDIGRIPTPENPAMQDPRESLKPPEQVKP